MSIQLLPADVIAQIKSSVTITTLNGVVTELIKNSLDAGAIKIDISVDFANGGCIVEDNGLGILPSEFGNDGGLGKLYYSSKLKSQGLVHGSKGSFLASLSALSLLSITSHHHQHRSHNTISMHQSKVIARHVPAPLQHHLPFLEHGTKVSVRDLFGGMPVRVKHRAIIAEKQRGSFKQWEELKRITVMLLLSWPGSVSVTLRGEGAFSQKTTFKKRYGTSKQRDITIEKSVICGLLSQASLITPDQTDSWVSIDASTSKFRISGLVSLIPTPTKQIQFISLGIRPVITPDGQGILHDEINRLFFNSAFGNEKENDTIGNSGRDQKAQITHSRDGKTHQGSKWGRKPVDRWPMFYINIQSNESLQEFRHSDMNAILDENEKTLPDLLEFLRVVILAFLNTHHFKPTTGGTHRIRHPEQTSEYHVEKRADRLTYKSPATSLLPKLKSTRFSHELADTIPSRPLKDSSINQNQSKFAFLGNGIKMPSFRRSSSKIESPFDAWSHIKCGMVTRPSSPVHHMNSRTSDVGEVRRPSSVPPSAPIVVEPLSPNLITRSPAPIPVSTCTNPLVSKQGTILRRPFADILRQDSRSQLPTTEKQRCQDFALEDCDQMVSWVNPTTKALSIVNKRSGHAVPEKEHVKTSQFQNPIRGCSNHNGGTGDSVTSNDGPSPWVSSILESWKNPVFQPVEQSIPHIHLGNGDTQSRRKLDDSTININQTQLLAGNNARISKEALKNAEVVSQVDDKFILAKADFDDNVLLVLIDQHAADERIRIETLLQELCTPPENAESGVATASLIETLNFELSSQEIQLFKKQKQHFANWGILYTFPDHSTGSQSWNNDESKPQLRVQSLPPGILERCKLDPRLLIDLLRSEAWKNQDSDTAPTAPSSKTWFEKVGNCPQGILDLLNSRACRSAIMFNDPLSLSQCELLVSKLAECVFPFQCAHGRPSVVPLLDIGSANAAAIPTSALEAEAVSCSFGTRFKEWKNEKSGLDEN